MSVERIPETKKFNQKIALDKLKEGDFKSCLKYLNMAYEIDPSDTSLLEDIADMYYRLGEYSVTVYAYALLYGAKNRPEYLLGTTAAMLYLSESFGRTEVKDPLICDEKTELLLGSGDHVIKKKVKVLEDKSTAILTSFIRENTSNMVETAEYRYKRNLERAREMVLHGDYAKALELMLSLDSDKRSRKDALFIMAECYLRFDDAPNVEKCMDGVLAVDPDNRVALAYKLMYIGQKENRNELIKAFYFDCEKRFYEQKDALRLGELALNIYGMAADEPSIRELAKRGFNKAETLAPFNLTAILNAFFVDLAEGDLSKCKERLAKLDTYFKIDPRADFAIVFHKLYMDKVAQGEADFAQKNAAEHLLLRSSSGLSSEILKDVDGADDIAQKTWSMLGSQEKELAVLAMAYLETVCSGREYRDVYKRILAHPFLDAQIKKYALKKMLIDDASGIGAIAIVTDTYVFGVFPSGYTPTVCKKNSFDCELYSDVYATLLFSKYSVDEKALSAIVEEVSLYYEFRSGKKDKNLLCAVICAEYLCTADTDEEVTASDLDEVCDCYGVDKAKVTKIFEDIFGANH